MAGPKDHAPLDVAWDHAGTKRGVFQRWCTNHDVNAAVEQIPQRLSLTSEQRKPHSGSGLELRKEDRNQSDSDDIGNDNSELHGISSGIKVTDAAESFNRQKQLLERFNQRLRQRG
jgi:hypothetical protein